MYKFAGLRGTVPRAGEWLRSWRRRHWLAAGFRLAFTATAGIVTPRFANATHDVDDSTMLSIELPLPELSDDVVQAQFAATASATDDLDWSTVTVHSGQTVGDIFRQQGVSAGDLQKLTATRATAIALRNIRPGQEFAFARGSDGALKALRFDRDEQTRITETVVDGGFRETVQDRGVRRRTDRVAR